MPMHPLPLRKTRSAARLIIACALFVFSAAQAADVVNTASVSFLDATSTLSRSSNSVRTITSAPAPAVVSFYSDGNFTTPASATAVGQPLFVAASAAGCDLDPAAIETLRIAITSKLTGDSESFTAVETGPGTGIFRVLPNVPTSASAGRAGDGIIATAPNDTLTASTDCDGSTATTTILIDPGGVVFDSKTNQLLAGARVTLVDAASGAPASVFAFDGTTPAPSTIVTAADGHFSFPAVSPGSYRLQIVPPSGYTAPSKVGPASLPPGHNIDAQGSYGGSFTVATATGAVIIDIPLDPAATGILLVEKTASRSAAEIGDFVDFTVTVKNVATVTLPDVAIDDRLPFGFAFVEKTAQLDGQKLPDPKSVGPDLHFVIGSLDPGTTVTLTYRTRVGVDATHGDGVNRAQASNTATPPATSNVATARVLVRSGVFTNRGIIFGRIFVDENRSRVFDDGEDGIPGVRLYLEDGSYIITDREGKFSFYGINPGTHVLKLDRTTLPPEAKLEPLNTRNAGDGGSVFVDVKPAEMHKANFAIFNPSAKTKAYIAQLRAAAQKIENGNFGTNLRNDLDRDGVQPIAADPRSLPASGILVPGVAVQPTAQDRTQSSDTFILGGLRATTPIGPGAGSSFGFSPSIPSTQNQNGRLPGTASSFVRPASPNDSPISSPIVTLPSVPLEQAASDQLPNEPVGFLDLKEGDTLPIAQTNVRVRSVPGGTITLRVNGQEVPASRIGKRVTDTARGVELTEFIGLTLQPGENRIELFLVDPFGNARASKLIRVIAPDNLGQITIKTPDNATADGKTPARVVVWLKDAHGVPVTARTALTLEASLGKWLVDDLNPREPGTQVFIEGGRAEYPLAAPVEPGESQVRVSSGIIRADAIVSFLPELRPLIAAGVVEGKINISHLDAGALRPISSRDTFDTELRDFAVHGNAASAAGRAAFFIKGKVRGNYLLTAAYDSEKDTRERLFRDIQPDEFYPVYGDASIKGFEAQSTGKLYVRVDNRKSYLLYGDFLTQSPNELQQLGNYNRSLNGVREHFENDRVRANAWASYDTTRQIVAEVRANGTSGPYFFQAGNAIVNSEKVEILTRDRNNSGVILQTVEMQRFGDYAFEPLTGQLLFKAPVPSLDADLNPVSIRVTYEVDQGGNKFWVYGADGQVKLNSRIAVGGSFARDENPLDRYQLYSGNALFDLGRETFLFGEFAHSEDAIVGSGNAERVELRHSSEKLSARIFWGRADDQFKNQTAILSGGRTEAGAQISYQLGKNTRALVQAIDSESHDSGSRRGVLAGVEQTFGRDIRLELGGRYSTETSQPASDTTALTAGATPNEVRSARAKLTLPVPWSAGAAHLFGEYEQDLVDADKRLAAIGGEYQLNTKTRLYARTELISSLGGPFELNQVQQQNNTVVGVESAYMKDGALFNEYRVRDAFTGRTAESAIGLRNLWTLTDGLRANTTFERVDPLKGSNDDANKSTAITGALEYTANPDWKGTARLELRTSQTVDSLLQSLGLAYRISESWTGLGRSILYLADNKGPEATNQTQARIQVGVAWRQAMKDMWNALAKYEFRTENGAPGSFDGLGTTTAGGDTQRRVHILSADVSFQPNADWILSAHFAGKLAWEDSLGQTDLTTAHLFVGHLTYDLTDRLDLGLNGSVLFSPTDGSLVYGFGPEIGYTLANNLRVGVGYNLTGFSDQDLTQEQYTNRGFFLALRLKFDESLFTPRRKEEEK